MWYPPQRERDTEPLSHRRAGRRARRGPSPPGGARRHAADQPQAFGHRPGDRDGPARRGVHREAPARGVPGPRHSGRGERGDRWALRVPLAHRPAGRDRELRARPAALLRVGRAGTRGRRRAGRGLRSESGRVLRGRARPRRDAERRTDPRVRPRDARSGAPRDGLSVRHPHDVRDQSARVRGALGACPGGPAARVCRARPMLRRVRAIRWVLGALAGPLGHGGRRADRPGGRRARHERERGAVAARGAGGARLQRPGPRRDPGGARRRARSAP